MNQLNKESSKSNPLIQEVASQPQLSFAEQPVEQPKVAKARKAKSEPKAQVTKARKPRKAKSNHLEVAPQPDQLEGLTSVTYYGPQDASPQGTLGEAEFVPQDASSVKLLKF